MKLELIEGGSRSLNLVDSIEGTIELVVTTPEGYRDNILRFKVRDGKLVMERIGTATPTARFVTMESHNSCVIRCL